MEYILIKEWMPTNMTEYLLSCVAVVTLGIVYEGLRTIRMALYRSEEVQDNVYQCQGNENPPDYGTLYSAECQCEPKTTLTFKPFTIKTLMTRSHQCQAILHAVQEFLGLSLMMITMTYNTPIAASVAVGHIIGYFFLSPLFSFSEQQKISQCCCN
ncbi:unnamed protein product [Bursaphelenchus okinawaensis]|uniref:Copper transport protein n=1 Tax=Bursaphelenchus okinawaensis TaxID=465554 RepID=A0A811KVA7_9BILA|nr:unnamed protein product [Bursaphelenchus okinawaensis]CAG9113898.1 unnamed protein product [Bursaphelenchus okinawaensis]